MLPSATVFIRVARWLRPERWAPAATIDGNELASAALQMLEQRKITSLFITDGEHRVEGIIHLHDLWGLELF